MLNNLVLVGRISNEPRIKVFDDGSKVCNFDLCVDRPFKNQEGTREVDFFPVTVWQAYADAVYQYCGVGSIIGVKGRLTTRQQDIGGMRLKTTEIIGERVAFINVIHQKEKMDTRNLPIEDEEVDLNEKVEKEAQRAKKKEDKEE